MRRCLLIICCICTGAMCLAQADSTLIYLRFPTVPPFSIIKVSDSTRFTKDDLAKRKAVMIIIFNPDCEHCRQETKEITAQIKLFKKTQLVMVSSLDHRLLKKFYEEYKIADHPNIIMGRDPAYFLGTFYQVRSFPAIFLYDKKGNFVKAFDGPVPVQKIAAFL